MDIKKSFKTMNSAKNINLKKYLLGLLYVIILSLIIVPTICFIGDKFFPDMSISIKQSCFYTLAIIAAIISAKLVSKD